MSDHFERYATAAAQFRANPTQQTGEAAIAAYRAYVAHDVDDCDDADRDRMVAILVGYIVATVRRPAQWGGPIVTQARRVA